MNFRVIHLLSAEYAPHRCAICLRGRTQLMADSELLLDNSGMKKPLWVCYADRRLQDTNITEIRGSHSGGLRHSGKKIPAVGQTSHPLRLVMSNCATVSGDLRSHLSPIGLAVTISTAAAHAGIALTTTATATTTITKVFAMATRTKNSLPPAMPRPGAAGLPT